MTPLQGIAETILMAAPKPKAAAAYDTLNAHAWLDRMPETFLVLDAVDILEITPKQAAAKIKSSLNYKMIVQKGPRILVNSRYMQLYAKTHKAPPVHQKKNSWLEQIKPGVDFDEKYLRDTFGLSKYGSYNRVRRAEADGMIIRVGKRETIRGGWAYIYRRTRE